jgi:hypothetical protein
MNFACSPKKLKLPYFDLTEHKTENGWYLYLDKGWTKTDNYFYKGLSSSWCKIYVDPFVSIETNKLRDFPIYYNKNLVTNFQKLDTVVPVDGIIEIKSQIKIHYKNNFYPPIRADQLSFQDCHNILFDVLIENVGTFVSNNKNPIYVPVQGGMDTLVVRSVFDYLGAEYKTFDMPPKPSTPAVLKAELSKNHWGFMQIEENDDTVIATGFYGDEWVLRNPFYVHHLLSHRGINIIEEFDRVGECYMKDWFVRYRKKCAVKNSYLNINEIMSQICNDFQIWHLNNTKIFSPLKHISLLDLLSADTQTIIDQVTDAKLSKSIIKKCNPDLMELLDGKKNQNDPEYFG